MGNTGATIRGTGQPGLIAWLGALMKRGRPLMNRGQTVENRGQVMMMMVVMMMVMTGALRCR